MTTAEKDIVQKWYDKKGKDNWPTFVCTYRYKGAEWGFQIVAENVNDARERMAALGQWGKVDGILYGEIPANPVTSLYVRALTLARNLFA